MMSNLNIGKAKKHSEDTPMEPVTFRESNCFGNEEKKMPNSPIVKTKGHNINEKTNADRFIPCRSYLESSHSLMMNNEDIKPNKEYSSGSDSPREDTSSLQNYNALLESQFFGGDDALNEMNLS